MGDQPGLTGIPPEVIDDDRRHRPRRRWPIVVAVLVVAALLLGRWLDQQQRSTEFSTLVTRAADAQASVADAAAKVDATRQYTMPLIVSSSSATVRAGLASLIDDAAAKAATEVRQARHGVASVRIVPWHDHIRQARSAFLAYLDRRAADLDAVAKGGDFATIRTDAVTADFVGSVAALRAAAPTASDATHLDQVFAPRP